MALSDKYDRFYDHAPAGAVPHTPRPRTDRWPRDRVEAILAVDVRGGTVLDIGCGGGDLLALLAPRFDALLGLEYSPARLGVARERLAGLPFTGIAGSAEDMAAIDTGSVDCIVCADVIEHVPDVYAAAAEIARVLRPGGTLVINTPNVAFLVKRLRLLAGRFPSTSQPNEGFGSDVLHDGGHLHYFTFRGLALLLERAGLVVERRMGYGRYGRVHDLWPALLSVGVQLVARKPTA